MVKSTDIGLRKFQDTDSLRTKMEAFLDSDFGRIVIGVLQNEAPHNTQIYSPHAHIAIQRLGVVNGFNLAINTLRAMGKEALKVEDIGPANFGAEEPVEIDEEKEFNRLFRK